MSFEAVPGLPWVFIDSCAVNRFAGLNVDPTKALAGSDFTIGLTPSLKAEYERGLLHPFIAPHIRVLLKALLQQSTMVAGGDDRLSRGTDWDLVSLSRTHVVITLDTKPPWDRARDNPGLLLWPELERALRSDVSLLAILEARAAVMAGERSQAS